MFSISFGWALYFIISFTMPNQFFGQLKTDCFELPTSDSVAFDNLCLNPLGLNQNYIQGYSRAQLKDSSWRAIVESRLFNIDKQLILEIKKYQSKYFYNTFSIYINYHFIENIMDGELIICDTSILKTKLSYPNVIAEITNGHINVESYAIRINTTCPSFIKIISFNKITRELKLRYKFQFEVFTQTTEGIMRGFKKNPLSPTYIDFNDGILHTIVLNL